MGARRSVSNKDEPRVQALIAVVQKVFGSDFAYRRVRIYAYAYAHGYGYALAGAFYKAHLYARERVSYRKELPPLTEDQRQQIDHAYILLFT